MNPRPGISPANPSSASYWHTSPIGAGNIGSRATIHCSLLTVHRSFTFSAKERDSETGLSYFGSRYYSSDLSIWLSVDPQSDKYASLSPYVYCADNPVRCVDPNGESVWITGDDGQVYEYKKDGALYLNGEKVNSTDEFSHLAQSDLTRLREKSPTASKILDRFVENDNFNITIMRSDNDDSNFDYSEIVQSFSTNEITQMTGEITWNPNGKGVPVESTQFTGLLEYNGLTALIHEFSHAFDYSRGAEAVLKYKELLIKEWVATYYENIVRSEMGFQLRTHYEVYRDAEGKFHGSPPCVLENGQPFLPDSAKKFF